MNNIILTLILSILTLFTFAQTESIRGNQFELQGKLINEITLTPHCGIIAWGTVMEFEIIEFSDSSYKRNSIGVIFTCPEFYKDIFFELSEIYKITITDENLTNIEWAIPNELRLTKYQLKKRLWVVAAEKLK